MPGASASPVVVYGRIVIGVVAAAVGAAHIALALLMGRIAILGHAATMSDRPLRFAALLSVWVLLLAAALASLRDQRKRNRDSIGPSHDRSRDQP